MPDRHKYHLIIATFAQTGKQSGMKTLEAMRKMLSMPIISNFNLNTSCTYNNTVITYKEAGELMSKLIKGGAADILSPPFTIESVSNRVGNVLENFWLHGEIESLKKEISKKTSINII